MPFEIRPVNRSVKLIVSTGGQELHINLRNKGVAYSAVLTHDMRTQCKLGYIQYKFIDKLPSPPVTPIKTEDPDLVLSTVNNPISIEKEDTIPTVVQTPDPTPPSSSLTSSAILLGKEELGEMKKSQLKEIAESYGIDTAQRKSSLIESILNAQEARE